MSESPVLTGRCLCGDIQYRLHGKFRCLCSCHCRSCRLAAGAPYVAWGTLADEAFTLSHGSLREIISSPGVTRGFCGKCGTSLTYRNEKNPGEFDLCLATLDQPELCPPEFHLWVSEKLPWVTIDDGLPQYPEWRTAK